MDESDTSELREPLLPLSGDNEDNEEERPQHFFPEEEASGYYQFQYPPERIPLGESNSRKSLAIFFATLATKSIWSQNILSIFVSMVWKNRPIYIGIVQAVTGILQTITTIIAMWSTRHYNSRNFLLKLSCAAGIFAVVVSVVSIALVDPKWGANTVARHTFGSQTSKIFFLVANGLWGVFWGILDMVLPMVLIESTSVLPEEKRQKVVKWHDKLPLGGAFGSLLAMAFFFRMGNEWTVHNCVLVLIGGLVCNLCGVFVLCCLRPIAFDIEDENWMESQCGEGDNEPCEPLISNEVVIDTNVEEVQETSMLEDDVTEEEEENYYPGSSVTIFTTENLLIPLLIHLSDVVSSLAGGISAWYFPLFLVTNVGVRPILLQFLCLTMPVGQQLSIYVANAFARAVGPPRACVLLQWLYVALLLLMLNFQSAASHHAWEICVLYFLHESLMNSTSSLSQGLIENYVPFEERHLWNWAKTAQKLLWSSSGLLGGWIASHRGIVTNLYWTAVLQFLASYPLIVLYCLSDPPLKDEFDDDDSLYYDCESNEEERQCNENGGTESITIASCMEKKEGASKSSAMEFLIPSTPETELAESDYDGNEDASDFHDALPSTTWVV